MTEMNNYGNIFYPINNNSAVIKSMLSGRMWEKKIVSIFHEYITQDDTVLDVGSYIGTHMVEMSKLANRVYSFEPVPLISACVKKTIKAMNISNVKHYNVACGNHTGSDFIHTNYNGDSSLGGIRDHKFSQKFECKVVKLDDIINEPIKLMKIDVEGHEFEVLAGATNIIEEYKPIIIIETFKTKRNLLELKHFCECFEYDYSYISCDNYLLIKKQN